MTCRWRDGLDFRRDYAMTTDILRHGATFTMFRRTQLNRKRLPATVSIFVHQNMAAVDRKTQLKQCRHRKYTVIQKKTEPKRFSHIVGLYETYAILIQFVLNHRADAVKDTAASVSHLSFA